MNSIRGPLLLATTGLLITSCVSEPKGYARGYSDWKEQREALDRARREQPALADDAALEDLLAYARTHNPGLEAAFLAWRETLESVELVQALPEPRLSFSAFVSEIETRTGPMQARVSLAQPIPWIGERGLAGDVAFAHSEARRMQLEVTLRDLDARVRQAWYEAAWLEESISITQVSRELLAHWESVARSRLETGIGDHADVIRAQVELGKVEDRLQSLVDLRRPLASELNAALGRSVGEPLPSASLPRLQRVELDPEALLSGILESSPELQVLRHRVAAAEYEVELARKEFYPDLFVGADYTFIGSSNNPGVAGSGDDALALTLGVELPIWRSKYRAGVRAAEARVRTSLSRLDDTHNRLSASLERALYEFRDAKRRVELFRESLIPKGEESLRALDSAYQAGSKGFLDLIDAQRVLLEFQLQAARAEADRARALAEVDRLCGGVLTLEQSS